MLRLFYVTPTTINGVRPPCIPRFVLSKYVSNKPILVIPPFVVVSYGTPLEPSRVSSVGGKVPGDI